jgi:MFS family permease
MKLPRAVVVLGAVSFLTDASSEMIYPLLPIFLSSVLGAGALAVGAIEGAAESVASLLKLASGWWSDRASRRKPLVVAGYALASAARPLIGVTQSAWQVLGLRLTDRVGKGLRSAPRDALIADAVAPALRGRAFGFHRAADHAGAVVGPLIAFALLGAGLSMRGVFLAAAIPAALAVLAVVVLVREPQREVPQALSSPTPLAPGRARLGRPFWTYLVVVLVFTLGNSSDAFLLLRANELGVPAAQIPILWAAFHVVKSLASTPAGALSDRVGRRPLIIAGWVLYAAVYLGFARANEGWHAWALFLAYGAFFALTEGVEKALVADLAPAQARGTAFGWYNLVLGIGALPASLVFGAVWQWAGAPAAFAMGAALSVVASVGLFVLVRPPSMR